jgi:ATP-binding cassette subfamily B protein
MPFKSKKPFPVYKQSDAMDCGPTCLKMIAEYHGKPYPLQQLRRLCKITKQGVSVAGIMEAAEEIGLKTLSTELPLDLLIRSAPVPCILHWDKHHFVVLSAISNSHAMIADPAIGKTIQYDRKLFEAHWLSDRSSMRGRALFLEPGEAFHQRLAPPEQRTSLWSLWPYLRAKRAQFIPVAITVVIASICSLLIPLLTQYIFDKGIKSSNLSVVWLISIGQLMLFMGRLSSDFVRTRWLYKIGAAVSMQLLQAFLFRLTSLPLSFFDNRHASDNMQRVNDNMRIEDFLTNWLVTLVIALITLLVLGGVLFYYNGWIFGLFISCSIAALIWNGSFKSKRYTLDQQKFRVMSASQQILLEIFSAMQEIKLTGSEQEKKDRWQFLQQQAISLKLQSLRLDQWVQGASSFIHEIKNVLITGLAAMLVINGEITMGSMLAVTYICGQMNMPVLQLVEFIRSYQHTLFSLQRMDEVHREPEEDAPGALELEPELVTQQPIRIINMSFQYGLRSAPYVLRNIHCTLPAGKVTAVVGMSGSGKTTLLKLLLKFYNPVEGDILLGNIPLKALSAKGWRRHCGVVMQDGYIFMDTVANNVYAGALVKDPERLYEACRLANMHDFFASLPFGYETIVGRDGYGLSEGQIQRLLIARLIYKNPSFIFLDEATNSLDAHNERTIIDNLNHFFPGKTVVIVAHRLSTVRYADQILVLDKGLLVECGNHEQLIARRGAYHHLVKNQLELGT